MFINAAGETHKNLQQTTNENTPESVRSIMILSSNLPPNSKCLKGTHLSKICSYWYFFVKLGEGCHNTIYIHI